MVAVALRFGGGVQRGVRLAMGRSYRPVEDPSAAARDLGLTEEAVRQIIKTGWSFAACATWLRTRNSRSIP